MKNYKVTMSVLFKPTFEINAESPEEAERIAWDTDMLTIEDASYSQGLFSVMGVEVDMPKEEVDKRTLSETKAALDRIVKQYIAMVDEFAQYRRESIKWTAEDLVYYPHPTHTISMEQAQVALINMVSNHDPEIGITWQTIAEYVERHGTKR